jgi:hypothetical protein
VGLIQSTRAPPKEISSQKKCRVQGGLLRSERKHGLSTEQFPVSAYIGSSKNLKDLTDLFSRAIRNRERRPDPQRAESPAHGSSTAVLILAWGWYVLTTTILFIRSKSKRSTKIAPRRS